MSTYLSLSRFTWLLIYTYIYQPICLSANKLVYLSICLPVSLSTAFSSFLAFFVFHLSIGFQQHIMFIYLIFFLSTCLIYFSSTCIPIYIYICLPFYLTFCLSISPSYYLPINLFICLPVFVFTFFSDYLSIFLFVDYSSKCSLTIDVMFCRCNCKPTYYGECNKKAISYNILPPIMSASIRSKFSFKYGKIQIHAKLPKGNWLYPSEYQGHIGKYIILSTLFFYF